MRVNQTNGHDNTGTGKGKVVGATIVGDAIGVLSKQLIKNMKNMLLGAVGHV